MKWRVEFIHLRVGSAFVILGIVHADDTAVLDCDILRFRILWIEGSDASVMENQVNLR